LDKGAIEVLNNKFKLAEEKVLKVSKPLDTSRTNRGKTPSINRLVKQTTRYFNAKTQSNYIKRYSDIIYNEKNLPNFIKLVNPNFRRNLANILSGEKSRSGIEFENPQFRSLFFVVVEDAITYLGNKGSFNLESINNIDELLNELRKFRKEPDANKIKENIKDILDFYLIRSNSTIFYDANLIKKFTDKVARREGVRDMFDDAKVFRNWWDNLSRLKNNKDAEEGRKFLQRQGWIPGSITYNLSIKNQLDHSTEVSDIAYVLSLLKLNPFNNSLILNPNYNKFTIECAEALRDIINYYKHIEPMNNEINVIKTDFLHILKTNPLAQTADSIYLLVMNRYNKSTLEDLTYILRTTTKNNDMISTSIETLINEGKYTNNMDEIKSISLTEEQKETFREINRVLSEQNERLKLVTGEDFSNYIENGVSSIEERQYSTNIPTISAEEWMRIFTPPSNTRLIGGEFSSLNSPIDIIANNIVLNALDIDKALDIDRVNENNISSKKIPINFMDKLNNNVDDVTYDIINYVIKYLEEEQNTENRIKLNGGKSNKTHKKYNSNNKTYCNKKCIKNRTHKHKKQKNTRKNIRKHH